MSTVQEKLDYYCKLLITLPNPDTIVYYDVQRNNRRIADWEGLFSTEELFTWYKATLANIRSLNYQKEKEFKLVLASM